MKRMQGTIQWQDTWHKIIFGRHNGTKEKSGHGHKTYLCSERMTVKVEIKGVKQERNRWNWNRRNENDWGAELHVKGRTGSLNLIWQTRGSQGSEGNSMVRAAVKGDDLYSANMLRLWGGPNITFETVLVSQAVCFSQGFTFPCLLLSAQYGVKTNSNYVQVTLSVWPESTNTRNLLSQTWETPSLSQLSKKGCKCGAWDHLTDWDPSNCIKKTWFTEDEVWTLTLESLAFVGLKENWISCAYCIVLKG